MSAHSNRVLVYDDTNGEPVVVGSFVFNAALRRRAGVSSTFTYDPTWLTRPDAYAIDPHLSLFGRSSTVPGLPGCLQDCSPDRWGRNLVEKRLRAVALREGTGQRTLTDVDYLLGVADLTRQERSASGMSRPLSRPHPAAPSLIRTPSSPSCSSCHACWRPLTPWSATPTIRRPSRTCSTPVPVRWAEPAPRPLCARGTG